MAADQQCAFIKENGERCKNYVANGSDSVFCHAKHKHQPAQATAQATAQASASSHAAAYALALATPLPQELPQELVQDSPSDDEMASTVSTHDELRLRNLQLQDEINRLLQEMGDLRLKNERLETNLNMAQHIIQIAPTPGTDDKEKEIILKMRTRKARSEFYHQNKNDPRIKEELSNLYARGAQIPWHVVKKLTDREFDLRNPRGAKLH
jgi:hypothetical protein